MSDSNRRDPRTANPADDSAAGRMDDDRDRRIPDLTHEDFKTLPVEELAERTGLTPPDGSAAEESTWREKAWQDHVKDLEHRDEWGTATQATKPPKGEDPNL